MGCAASRSTRGCDRIIHRDADRCNSALAPAAGSRQALGMKDTIVRVYVTMLEADPSIWRRIELPAGASLKLLHDVIQVVMGWEDRHLHHFAIGGVRYGEATPEDPELRDERGVKLAALRNEGERAFEYVYDYGDEWHCAIVLEALAAARPGVACPRVVEGARRGPPEDVGGPLAYLELLEAITDPKDGRHAQLLERIGGAFDPDAFDVARMNRALARLAPKPRGRRKRARPAAVH